MQADILTLSSMGCHPLSVATTITIQDSMGVEAAMAIDAEWVADQARCLLEDVAVTVFKVGAVGSIESIAAIAEVVSDYPDVPLVLDPALSVGRGSEPVSDEIVSAMRELLIPQTTILTPNSHEIRRLVQEEGDEADDGTPEECARQLLALGAEFVLVTGTHEGTNQILNTLYSEQGVVRTDSWQRLPGSFHGSGATLAAAIAATLANGLEVSEAVRDAQEYTWQSLKFAYRTGMGQLIPDRLFWAREDESRQDDSRD